MGDDAGKHGGYRADQNIAVQDVAELMGNHAFDFLIAHQAKQTLGKRNR